jgi:hypothetical protein
LFAHARSTHCLLHVRTARRHAVRLGRRQRSALRVRLAIASRPVLNLIALRWLDRAIQHPTRITRSSLMFAFRCAHVGTGAQASRTWRRTIRGWPCRAGSTSRPTIRALATASARSAPVPLTLPATDCSTSFYACRPVRAENALSCDLASDGEWRTGADGRCHRVYGKMGQDATWADAR